MNNAILIIGPPRSGTSITTRILQAHLETDFPFEINRHAEPEELVKIENAYLERNKRNCSDRLYFPECKPDIQLYKDICNFFEKYSETECIIKSPIFSIINNWIQMSAVFRTLYVYRGIDKVAESIMYHKKFTKKDAYTSSEWYHHKTFLTRDSTTQPLIIFKKDKTSFQASIEKGVEFIGKKFNQEIFNKYWDESQIEYYKN